MKFPKVSFRKKSKTDKQEPSAEAIVGPGVSNTKGGSGGKQWLMLHVEKICLLAAIGIFGFLVYSVAGKLSLDPKQNPEELANKAEQMEARMEQSDGDGFEERIPDFAAQVEKANQCIKTDTYSFEALTGVEARQMRKRTRPQFLPAENIWVEGGSGIFWLTGGGVAKENEGDNPVENGGRGAMKLPQAIYQGEPPPEGATAEIKHWAVITALIPIKKQKAIYERHFQEAEAYQPLEDVPDYMLARIQRIEVTPDDPQGEKADWSHPDLQWEWTPESAQSEVSISDTALGRLNPGKHDSWATEADEMVDPQYVHPRLTTPLGPLGYSGWQPWATHPEIPLAVKNRPQNAEDPRRGNRPGDGNRDGPPPKGRGNPVWNKKEPDRGDRFGDFFTPPAEKAAPDSATQPVAKPEEKQPQQQLANQNQLLRLFDFDVEPDKTYLYRVQLLLKNPNYDQPSRILKNPRDRKPRFTPDTWLPWSRQSTPVYIPPVMAVYAGGIFDPVKKIATVIIRKPTGPQAQGALQIGKLSVQQGGVIGGKLEDSLIMDGLSGKLTKGAQPLETDLLLVDVRPRGLGAGGTGLSELLLLDATGQFLLQNTGLDQGQATLFNKLSEVHEQAMKRKNKEKEKQKNQEGEKDERQKDKDRLGGKKSKKNNTKSPNRRE